MKNLMNKTRKPGDAYITTEDPLTGWRWEVLKVYQADSSKKYSRAFCFVHGFADEAGDCYVSDIGHTIVDFDHDVFATTAAAREALFGPRKPAGRPGAGKVYRLTGPGASIEAGNTWDESEVEL
jgi:hypothetical protein